jgi:hypothetical protein
MNGTIAGEAGGDGRRTTTVERVSDTEVVVTRIVNGPARLVFDAFTNAELFRQWWVPQSMGMTLLSCRMDVRVGGTYRLEFDVGGPVVLRERHPSKEALDAAGTGAAEAMFETFDQLDQLLVVLRARSTD